MAKWTDGKLAFLSLEVALMIIKADLEEIVSAIDGLEGYRDRVRAALLENAGDESEGGE